MRHGTLTQLFFFGRQEVSESKQGNERNYTALLLCSEKFARFACRAGGKLEPVARRHLQCWEAPANSNAASPACLMLPLRFTQCSHSFISSTLAVAVDIAPVRAVPLRFCHQFSWDLMDQQRIEPSKFSPKKLFFSNTSPFVCSDLFLTREQSVGAG